VVAQEAPSNRRLTLAGTTVVLLMFSIGGVPLSSGL
jgi:hypothetical protein